VCLLSHMDIDVLQANAALLSGMIYLYLAGIPDIVTHQERVPYPPVSQPLSAGGYFKIAVAAASSSAAALLVLNRGIQVLQAARAIIAAWTAACSCIQGR